MIDQESGQVVDPSSGQQTQSIQQEINRALRLHTTGQLAKAEELYLKILKADPDQPVALHMLGVIAHQMGKFDLAVGFMIKSLASEYENVEVHSNLGNSLLAMGNLEGAVTSCQNALAIQADYLEAHLNLGNAYKSLGRLHEALGSYQNILAFKPDYAEAYINIGNILSDLDRLDEAVDSYREALVIKANFAEAHNNLGNVFKKQGQLKEAMASYHDALVIKPGFAEAHNNLGIIYSSQKRLSDAEISFGKAIRIKPNFAEALNNLGGVYSELWRPEDAIVCFRKAIDCVPDFLAPYNNLGNIFNDLGSFEDAQKCYNLALRIQPDYAPPHISMAIQFWIKKEWIKCAKHLTSLFVNQSDVSDKINKSYVAPFYSLLNKLIEYKDLHPGQYMWHKNVPVLGVIGESHCLSAAHTVVKLYKKEYRAGSNIITGCKAWHLGGRQNNKYKNQFEMIAKTIPQDQPAVIMFGEIDCRVGEGILKHHKKHQTDLTDSVTRLVHSYVGYVTDVLGKRGITPIFYGVPAPFIDDDALSSGDQELLSKVVIAFNRALAKEAKKLSSPYLDVYSITNDRGGFSSGENHMDNKHVLPDVLGTLIRKLR